MNIPQYARDHFSLILVALIFLAILAVSWNYIFLFILALSVAVVILPLHRKMIRRIPAAFSAGILTTLILVVIIGVCVGIVVVVSSDFEYFMSIFQTIITTVTNLLHLTDGSEFSVQIVEEIKSVLLTMFPSFALNAAQMIPAVIIDMILFYALVYLSIIFGDNVWADLCSIVPESSMENVSLMAKKTKDILFSIYIVHVFIAFLTFFLAYGFFPGAGVWSRDLLFHNVCFVCPDPGFRSFDGDHLCWHLCAVSRGYPRRYFDCDTWLLPDLCPD